MSLDLTTVRWKLSNDVYLTEDERNYLIGVVSEKIGYPPPSLSNEVGDEGETTPDVVEVVKDKYSEVWKRGAAFSSSPLTPKGIIFHHTSGTLNGTIQWLTVDKKVSASYHVIIHEDGSRYRLVDDRKQAYHAGYGRIKGQNPNHVCLGIAFNGDTQNGKFRKTRELNSNEIESTIEWLKPRWGRMGLSFDWVTDHRTVDPDRRDDLAPDQLEVLIAALKKEFK